jgi:hypothetical protein
LPVLTINLCPSDPNYCSPGVSNLSIVRLNPNGISTRLALNFTTFDPYSGLKSRFAVTSQEYTKLVLGTKDRLTREMGKINWTNREGLLEDTYDVTPSSPNFNQYFQTKPTQKQAEEFFTLTFPEIASFCFASNLVEFIELEDNILKNLDNNQYSVRVNEYMCYITAFSVLKHGKKYITQNCYRCYKDLLSPDNTVRFCQNADHHHGIKRGIDGDKKDDGVIIREYSLKLWTMFCKLFNIRGKFRGKYFLDNIQLTPENKLFLNFILCKTWNSPHEESDQIGHFYNILTRFPTKTCFIKKDSSKQWGQSIPYKLYRQLNPLNV